MKKELGPAVTIGVIVVVVVIAIVWGYKTLQPAKYYPSPGVAGRPATGVPAYDAMRPTSASGGAAGPTSRAYTQPPKGAMPGMPPGAPGPQPGNQ